MVIKFKNSQSIFQTTLPTAPPLAQQPNKKLTNENRIFLQKLGFKIPKKFLQKHVENTSE